MVGKLRAAQVLKLGDGRHSDGGGLILNVRGGSRSWVYRYQKAGKRHEISLGSAYDLTLAQARAERDQKAVARRGGEDLRRPLRGRSLREVTTDAFEARRGDLRRNGTAGRWMSQLEVHVLPVLGDMEVSEITADVIADTLRPIWRTKHETARKALARLGIVLTYAQAITALRLPAGWANEQIANAKTQLGSPGKKPQHIPAMPWQEVPGFYETLGEDASLLALRLTILTASRSRPVRFAHVDQFDGDVWTIPAENMKTGEEFRIPLSPEAQRVVEIASQHTPGGFLFTGNTDKPISEPAMLFAMRNRGSAYGVHGFRSSFRDWAAETGRDWMLAEHALAHAVGSKVQRAYQRSDLLDQRRPLMQDWADHILG